MGSFSWRSCVTGRAIPAGLPTTIVLPDDRHITAKYEDYGVIGGIDIYVLHAVNYDIEQARALTLPFYDRSLDSASRFDDLRSKSIDCDAMGGPNLGGCGFKLMRASEYQDDMRYHELTLSYPCRDQGWVSEQNNDIDPRFSGIEPILDLDGLRKLYQAPDGDFHMSPFGFTVDWGHNSTLRRRDADEQPQLFHVRVSNSIAVDVALRIAGDREDRRLLPSRNQSRPRIATPTESE